MEFGPKEAIDAAERLIRPSRSLVGGGAPAPPSGPAPLPKPPSSGLVRTLGPGDPPPFDRAIGPRVSRSVVVSLVVLAVILATIAGTIHQ
jgi:hypothetical protein